jgi:uncharacterized glyoxalase superfamily protein PhnB
MPEPPTAVISELVPLLYVDDVGRSVAFYRDSLGFRLALTWEPEGRLTWCRMERDGAALMLQQACDEDSPADQRGRGVGFYFNCDDAEALHRELTAAGLSLAPPELAFYGMNQVFVTDPDGYALCFQSVHQTDSPP